MNLSAVGGTLALVSVLVDELTAEMSGRWAVTTDKTVHLFDLDARSYLRLPGTTSTRSPLDGRPAHLRRVERWPRVGETFFVWVADPDAPDLLEHCRQSSPVRCIERMP